MLSKPCKYCTYDHYANSLLFDVDPGEINKFILNEDNELPCELLLCPKCGFSPHSGIMNLEESKQCFCGDHKFKNKDQEKIEKQSVPQFFWRDEPENEYRKKVLFMICLDNSGSMNLTYRARHKLMNDYLEERQKKSYFKAEFGEASDLFDSKNLYVSRKELLLVYLKKQLSEIISNPKIDYRIYVVLFSHTVFLVGDGVTGNTRILSESEFEQIKDDPRECMKFGRKEGHKVFSSKAKPNLDLLLEKLESFPPSGKTSLAPAIAIGLGVLKAMKEEPDTCHFMIFTDGLANNGFGDIEQAKLLLNSDQCLEEYKNLGSLGLDWGVVFHLFAFEEDAGVKFLAQMTEKTKYGQHYKFTIEKQKEESKMKNKEENVINNEEEFMNKLKTAFKTPRELSFSKVELKIYSDKRIKMRLCKNNKEHSDEKDIGGRASLITKTFGDIYQLPLEKFGVIYEVPPEMKVGDRVNFQFQLSFRNFEDGRHYTIVFTERFRLKPEIKNTYPIDLKTIALVLIMDEFQTNKKKLTDFQNFIKEKGDLEVSKLLSGYLETYNKLQNLEKKNIKKDLSPEIQQKKSLKKEEEEKKKESEDEDEDSDEDTKTINTIEMRRQLILKQNMVLNKKK